jgi:hypothetical protein
MKHVITSFALACGLSASLGAPLMAQHAGEHIMLDPSELTWNDLPSLPGVKIAIIEGALNQAVPIMFRLSSLLTSKCRRTGIPVSSTSPSFQAPCIWASAVSSIRRRPARLKQEVSRSCSRGPTTMCGRAKRRSRRFTASGRGRSITSIPPMTQQRNS